MRRLEALKRFGLSTNDPENLGNRPKEVVRSQGGYSEEKTDEEYTEIWTDYIEYMDHQRTKGKLGSKHPHNVLLPCFPYCRFVTYCVRTV